PGRRWNVHVEPLGSTSQRDARSPTIDWSGPSFTRPRNRRATSSRSAADRAPNGLALVACPRTPSTYRRATGTVGSGDPGARPLPPAVASAATDAAANSTAKAATSERSRRIIPDPGPAARSAAGGLGARRIRQEERGEREQGEQPDEDDRELP